MSDGNTSFLRAARAGNLDKVLEHLKNNIDINTCNANGLNALHLASKDGHIHVVSELLKRGALVDSATKKGNTALHIASLAGQEEVVKLLLQHNASVNVQSQNGFTPLYMAAQENHDSVVKLLLANGANQSLATEDGFTPLAVAMQQGHDKVVAVLLESDTRGKVRLPALHIAAKKDDVKAATLLLENDHNPDVTSKSGFTPLHIASHYGNEAIANLLIQKGADVNYAAKHNISPLHVAAKWGKSNMVSLLLEKGANIESKTRDGLTPLHCAARSGHEQVVDMLLERGAPISAKTKNGLAPLHMAAQGEHVDAARILLYHRAPVDEVTVDYLTALHVAAHCGHVRVAKLLLDRNADANARALNGFTPLHIACKKNRIKVVELLLKHGASISATTESGLTPLHVASFMGCMNIVIYLLQHEAKVDVPTVRGETPLHLAARANQTDIIRILLRNNAQVDARAREQQTPLHIAARLGNVDIVMLLLQHGAQVDATTKDMYTALHIAAKEGQDEVAAALIENGAALDATTKKGFTPLHLAAKYGHIKVAQLLLQKGAAIDAQGKNGVTPLHVAGHYDHQNVALLLLEKGASPHATAKNGNTPLHIAARKNQMDIATTLLEYGAKADAESKAGFTPLHLSAQEGHTDMTALLLEHKAGCDHQARNGLTPMHLCAQEDKVNVAQILLKNGADVEKTTKAGYTPLHVAAHFGQANMVRFLLQNGANVDAATGIGYTPLHQAAQQGHCHIVNLLLEHKADANAQTANGQTPLHIARKLGYISVLDSLKAITKDVTSPTQTQVEEKYRVVAPEAMHETFMTDSEEEGDEDTVICNQHYQYLTADEMKSLGDDSLPIDVTRDERVDSNRMVQSTDSQPGQTIEDIISPQRAQVHSEAKPTSENYIADNVEVERHPQHVGRKLQWKNFLVSFLVDARGGAMRGCRHSGVRIIVPARSASQPTRITCRYVKPQRTMHPPQLMEGEALASRVLELGPIGTKFLGPVIMEVPHFASLRGKEREIVILRSDNGETWREHTIDNSDEVIHDVLNECFEPDEINQLDELGGGRICRFVTYDFPQYFAVVSRIRQEVHAIGPEGGMVSSTVVPQVQAVFPQGALTKKIKVGLQAQPIEPELTAKLLGRGVAVSPIVTVEPRRRKFHKAITLSMPAPKAHSQGMINQYSGNAPTLRLLCSITGGPSRAQWEDVTGSTPLTFVNDCVSFTTTVSARFWLMDCRNISEATKMATELYREAIHVPFMAKFVVFAKRIDINEARLRVFCMTDDKEDKTLEHQEHFTEVAKSRDVEVLESKSQYIEMAGNLVPVTKSGDPLQLTFKAFRENRLPFNVRVKDQHADTIGRTLFMREPKVAKGEPPQQPICILNIVLPEQIIPDQTLDTSRSHEILLQRDNYNYLGDLRIVDISNLLGEDWERLAPEIGFSPDEVNTIRAQHPTSTAQQAQSMIRQFKMVKPCDQNILENGLRVIGRNDIIEKCMKITSYIESSRLDITQRKRISLENGYDEADIMKESESVEELVRQEDRRLQQMRERDELKYSAEEKIVEDSESDDENIKRSVAERREKIVKRLSIERQIPASTQKKEIDQEITEIKRKSLIEDKKAIHEEEIMLQMPTDNIIKSAIVPDQILKLKTNKIEQPDVSKSEFDKELQDKFKKTVKILEDEDHEELIEGTSKIVYDSTVTEKATKIESMTVKEEIILPAAVTTYASFGEDNEDSLPPKGHPINGIPATSTVTKEIGPEKTVREETIKTQEVLMSSKREELVKDKRESPGKREEKVTFEETVKKEDAIIKEETVKVEDASKIQESTKIKEAVKKEEFVKMEEATKFDDDLMQKKEKLAKKIVVDVTEALMTKDHDLEKKLTKQKEKIEQHKQDISEQIVKSTDVIISDSDTLLDNFIPKSYYEKPRESLTEAEFYKSIEETITKKMSEGLIQINDDILSSDSKDIPELQTPPPTPIEIQSQKSGKYESPESIPEEIEGPLQVDNINQDQLDAEHSKEPASQMLVTTTTTDSDIPKPTPRSRRSIVGEVVGDDERATERIAQAVEPQSQADKNIEQVDFKQSKQFWQSLESQSQSEPQAPPPIPKPRMQVKIADDSLDSQKDSSSHGSKASSEPQVEYSETSSIQTFTNEDRYSREDDSEMSDARIEDELCPNLDMDKSESKSAEIQNVDQSEKPVAVLGEATDDEDSENNPKPQASFYIGESSTNIITKSTTDKRQDYAFDNKGYEGCSEDDQLTTSKTKVLHSKSVDESSSDYTKSTVPEQIGIVQKDIDDECSEEKPYVLSVDIPETNQDEISENKLFRQDSETRNDILEMSVDNEETDSNSKRYGAVQQSAVISKSYETEQLHYEDQAIPVQHIVLQDVASHTYELTEKTTSIRQVDNILTYEAPKEDVTHIQTQELEKDSPAQMEKPLVETIGTEKKEKVELKTKAEPKLDLNLEKSELEPSEKSFAKGKHEDISTSSGIEQKAVLSPIKPFKGFTTYQETSDGFIKTLLIDPSQVDQSMVDKTLDEVQESLEAVEEELIEVVKDGKLIKQSPSEFEFKLLPHIKCSSDPIQESHQEDVEKQEKHSTDDYPSLSSADESSSKGEIVHRLKKETQKDSLNRWSVPDMDHSSSGDSHYQSFERTDSRPLSSDIENLMTCGNSSEYQSALDASLLPESTEYVSAVSTLDHSGKTISSHESMKSLDSETSANLGSMEVSEISETLVPSVTDPDMEREIQEQDEEDFDVDDSEVKLSTLEDKFCGVLMEDYQKSDDEIPSLMKRSHEMTFQSDISQEAVDEPKPERAQETTELVHEKEETPGWRYGTSVEDSRLSEELKFASSLEDGSVLSMSLSSASCVDTVVDLAGSYGSSSLAGAEVLIRDDYTGTSFEEPSKTDKIDSMVMTSSMGKEEETNYANTQITTVTISSEAAETDTKRKGHKRSESTSISNTDFLKDLSMAKTAETTTIEEEPAVEKSPEKSSAPVSFEGRDSGSESDYDAYESEYSRSFKAPTSQKKSKDKRVETYDKDQEPEKRPFTPSQSVSEAIMEDVAEEIETMKPDEPLRRPSQNMHDYSNIPDITVTEDLQKYSEEEDDDFQDNVLYKAKTQEELDKKEDDTPIHYAQEQVYSIAEDQFQELIQRDYESKLADITTKFARHDDEEKADSPDSFEMLEQPDISDEFVIIEEVAKEAHEHDPEGKSIQIKNVKYVKKHDEEVEQILVKSAPAAPNAGSTLYRDDLNFEFEESPPMDKDQEAADAAAASKRWVEMQLSDNAAHLRYPYEMERGILEDIKEEDTEFEVGSSRISSFKDSFSSTPEYDVLAGRKYFTREHDNISMSSLQEFESLEQAISLENRRAHQGSQDSLSNGSFTKRYMARSAGQGDDISLSSLKEFEGLENACLEAHLIEIKAKEEAALLSRSDESNKSNNSNGEGKPASTATVTTVTTVTNVSQKTMIDKTFAKAQQDIETLLRAKLDECEEDASNIMEVSTDSLDLALRKSKSPTGNGKDDSRPGSCDSLEINKSGDIMTSSLDSFEISKDATARSSRSDVDSLEQQILQDVRRDSIDSIELEYALRASKMDRDSLEEPATKMESSSTTTTTIVQGPIQTITRVVTTISSGSQQSQLCKDISNDSLNLNPAEVEQLLSSTGSLDHTSSTATNATYQNETDSQMSGSMTSCGSNTLIDTLESNFPDIYPGSSSSVITSTTTTSRITSYDDSGLQQQFHQQQEYTRDGEKRYDYFEIFEKDSEKDMQKKSKKGGDDSKAPEGSKEQGK